MTFVKKLCAVIAIIAILALLSSGIFSEIGAFLEWYFKLKYTQPDISRVGSIAVRILTHFASFGLVGLLFEAFGKFNSKAMAAVYAISSTILGFVFAYIVWKIEEYIVAIIIVLGAVTILTVVLLIVCFALGKKRKKEKKTQDQD